MKIIIRTRNVNNIRPETMLACNKLRIEPLIFEHPKGLTFAQFNNEIFSKMKDELYLLVDDDIVIDERVLMFESVLNANDDIVAVAGIARPNDLLISKIYRTVLTPNFGFGCCLIKGSFAKNFIIPAFMECCEDDVFQNYVIKERKKVFVMGDLQFPHLSDNWREKFIKNFAWHVANSVVYWNTYRRIDKVTLFPYDEKTFIKWMDNVYRMITPHDRGLASKVRADAMIAFNAPKLYMARR